MNRDLEAIEAPPLNSSTTSFLQIQQEQQENEHNNPEITESFPVQKPSSTFSLPQVSEESSTASNNSATDLPSCGSPKQKNSSRRNAWGNLSYADLITQAIQSAPEQRLTLSQIYEWVVKNVPYFKDKGDIPGWKCSIKHNLSLNSRFKRVQNEGQGESSWWMMNPESIPNDAFRNLSYADYITLAIQSTPEKRLTLSQIYEWVVKNVPYYKDKGDIFGWKCSIRHNLYFSNRRFDGRFKKVQSEGQGESGWWMMNPDAAK